MKKQIGLITNDRVLYGKIRLLLRELASVALIGEGDARDGYNLLIADLRVAERVNEDCVTLGDGGTLPLSFRHEDLISLLDASEKEGECITLSSSTQSAYISGEAIKLTEVEFKLLEAILSSDGYVSKQEILRTVWGEGYDEGVVNVYVHYLRKKLESDGRRVIISSRGEGYKIDEKYRRKR